MLGVFNNAAPGVLANVQCLELVNELVDRDSRADGVGGDNDEPLRVSSASTAAIAAALPGLQVCGGACQGVPGVWGLGAPATTCRACIALAPGIPLGPHATCTCPHMPSTP